jgi:hypothetical protein
MENKLNNDVNFVYFLEIDKIYTSFDGDIKSLQNLLYLIYKIYYRDNQFNIIDDSVKQSLDTALKLIIKSNNYFI